MWGLETIRRLNQEAARKREADIPGADDHLVPASIAAEDPARWAEYNRKFNDLISRREDAEKQRAARARETPVPVQPRKEAL